MTATVDDKPRPYKLDAPASGYFLARCLENRTVFRHSREGGNPEPLRKRLGSRLRGNDGGAHFHHSRCRPSGMTDFAPPRLRFVLVLLTAVCLLWPQYASANEVPDEVLRAEADRVAVMQKAKDAVLAIFSADGGGGGSGVVITPDGYALSNFHVAQPCGVAMKCGMADGKVYDAVVVGLDPTGDVALIKLFGRDDFPTAEMADSDRVEPGDWCFAMGNPFLLATNFQPTVTYGIVSGVHRYQFPAGTLLEYADCIQTDASINPGNSGGPLFDAEGRLIGINGRGSFEKRGRVNVGVAYAISINQIRNFLGYLRSGRIVDHATLGAVVGFDAEGRVVVTDILDDCDAYRRGLRYDDEIVSFGGRPIFTPNAFKNVLGIFPKGWRVPLSFRRDGKRHDVLVRLEGVHSTEELIQKATGGPGEMPMPLPDPDKDPDSKKPGKPGEKPKLPIPQLVKRAKPKLPLPEVVKKHYEEKRGYANYYFNRLNRDRVIDAWAARGDLSAYRGPWRLTGHSAGGAEFVLRLSDEAATLRLPAGEFTWAADSDSSAALPPPQSNGLLPALNLWRRLAVEGPEKFGEVTYLGTAPLPGRPEPVDVLVGLHKGVEVRFHFDPAAGLLLSLELFPLENIDPCEVYFSEYRRIGGRMWPGQIDVRVGDDPYATLTVRDVQVQP